MRPHLLLAVLCALLLLKFGNLPAQNSDTQNQGSKDPQTRMLAFLSPADREKFIAARKKALDENPDLKAEDDALMKERPGPDASKEDRQAYREKWMTHQQKLRQVMLKDDPSLASIFDEIDKHRSQMRAQQQDSNGGNPPPPPPPDGNPPPPPPGNSSGGNNTNQ